MGWTIPWCRSNGLLSSVCGRFILQLRGTRWLETSRGNLKDVSGRHCESSRNQSLHTLWAVFTLAKDGLPDVAPVCVSAMLPNRLAADCSEERRSREPLFPEADEPGVAVTVKD